MNVLSNNVLLIHSPNPYDLVLQVKSINSLSKNNIRGDARYEES